MWNFHKTSSVFIKRVPFYCGIVALSIAYLVGFLKNRVRSYYGRTLSLIPAVYGTSARFNRRVMTPHALFKLVRVLA